MSVGSKNRDEWENDRFRLDLLTMWRIAGKTESEIAKQMGIAYSTLRKWKDESPAIKEALEKGAEELASELAGHMVKRARGYDYEETKTTILGNVKRGGKVIEDQKTAKVERVTKHVQPDVGAQIFLLTNLEPERWKNTQRVAATVGGALSTNVANAVQIVLPDNGTGEAVGDGQEK